MLLGMVKALWPAGTLSLRQALHFFSCLKKELGIARCALPIHGLGWNMRSGGKTSGSLRSRLQHFPDQTQEVVCHGLTLVHLSLIGCCFIS